MAEEGGEYSYEANGEGFEQAQGFENFSGDVEAAEPMDESEKAAGDTVEGGEDDEDDRKLFVGNLSWETQQKDLKDYFQTFGEVTSCTLKTDPESRRSRGFGFVVFKDPASVEKVLQIKEHKLQGRVIDPKRANPRREVIKKIFCGKVDPGVPEADIREYFEKYGKIEKLDLPFDKVKDQRRAFCFIEFEKEETVKKIIDSCPHKLNDQEIDVKKATPTNQNKRGRGGFAAWGGGWGGGRGGGARGGRGGGWGGQGYNNNYYNNYNQGYGSYGGYGGYGGYDNSYYQGYGSGWGGYDQGYYGSYSDYNGGWGYDQASRTSRSVRVKKVSVANNH
ncbi:heterogeneous nuclear ribonucleoprotein D-like isoform X2 [Ylistrum balloti]|uniref:heterogeneous nuclear ribonucleoprotein D-like isoform X2 n=1 Tax=Ylistrum balloti TaxID=509963 RepID=UPI002905F372|nr:heterogeneous nuclear ribonucleoprotein D-like isoform X2 [Ylistrum balloti]